MKLMSFSMTTEAFRRREKTVSDGITSITLDVTL